MMLHPSNLDDRVINSLKRKLISLEKPPNIAAQMLSLPPACLLKGVVTIALPNGQYQTPTPYGELVANFKTALRACERLSDSYMAS